MKILFFITLSSLWLPGFSQIEVPKLVNPIPENSFFLFKEFRSLRNNSKLIICYRQYSYWNLSADWELITADDNNKLQKFRSDVYLQVLKKVEANTENLDSLLNLFFNNDIFSISNSGCCYRSESWTGCDTLSDVIIYDGLEYDFLVITKTAMKRLYYYSPTPCDDERRRILNIIHGLWKY